MAVHLVLGDDESIRRTAVATLVQTLVGDGDRALMVDEFDGDEYGMGALVDAALTGPFLTDRRVVVARGAGRFTAEELAELVGYLADPLDSTDLVIEWGSERRTKAFNEALAGAGADIVSTNPPNRARERSGWVVAEAAKAGVQLSAAAVDRLVAHLGDNVGDLDGILRTLASTYGTGNRLGPDDVDPFVGDAGGVPPWDLTDAIDRGDTRAAIDLLARMTGGGGRHPLQVMAILHGHYVRLAKLDGSGATDEATAASALGIKPGFPARKALAQHRALGGGRVRRAIEMLAVADLDLRGQRELPEDLVLEVLVARLSRLSVAAA